jgi:hypothetical protein
MRQRCAAFVAGLTIEVEMERRARRELDRPFCKGTEPELWSLQISENADWPARRALYPPDRRKPGMMVVMGAMTKVEPEDVDAGLE